MVCFPLFSVHIQMKELTGSIPKIRSFRSRVQRFRPSSVWGRNANCRGPHVQGSWDRVGELHHWLLCYRVYSYPVSQIVAEAAQDLKRVQEKGANA